MVGESKIGLAAEGSGPAVRTYRVSRLLPDGTVIEEEQQIVGIARADGGLVDIEGAAQEQLSTLKDIRSLLRVIACELTGDDVNMDAIREAQNGNGD